MNLDQIEVFISYNHKDGPIVLELVRTLRSRGLTVFLDRDYLVPGQPWPDLLENCLRSCKAVVVCLGPYGLGSWQLREQQLALDRQAGEAGFPVIPVLLPGANDPPLNFLRLQTWVDFRNDLSDQTALNVLVGAIDGKAPIHVGGRGNPRVSVCPYRGLEPFREEDEPFFVGREAFTNVLIDKVNKQPLVGVVGPSGSGKSSVVLAGLVPTLRRRANGKVWDVCIIRPGFHPLRQLAASLIPADPGLDEFARVAKLKERSAQLAKGDVSLADLVTHALDQQRGTDRILLIVDQWEELYTFSQGSQSDQERNDFLKILLAGMRESPLSVVLTLRGDFYGRALQDRALGDVLQDAVVNISPMNPAELKRAIVEPATNTQLSFEPELVEQILGDLGNEPGNLPLLEFLLKELWLRRDRNDNLGFAAYAAIGGVKRAIATRAQTEFQKLGRVDGF